MVLFLDILTNFILQFYKFFFKRFLLYNEEFLYIYTIFLDISLDPRETYKYLNLSFFFGTVHLCPVRNTWLYRLPRYI